MTALHRSLEAHSIRLGTDVPDHLPAFNPDLLHCSSDVFNLRLCVDTKVVPSLHVLSVRLRHNQLRRRPPNSAPSKENQTNQSRPREFQHARHVADRRRGWKP